MWPRKGQSQLAGWPQWDLARPHAIKGALPRAGLASALLNLGHREGLHGQRRNRRVEGELVLGEKHERAELV